MRGRLERAVGLAIQRLREVYGEAADPTDPVVRAFVEFVALYLQLDEEGRRPLVHASW